MKVGLTFSVLTTGAILLLIVPADAQTKRDHRDNPTTRDHRDGSTNSAQGGVTVTSTGNKHGSECVKSVFGGPCVGGTPLKEAKDYKKRVQDTYLPPSTPPAPNRDHRTPPRMTGDSSLPR